MADSQLPVVSVVIPMLNERDFIGACLDSFALQDYPTECLDIIVVDGGSTDGSRLLVEERIRDQPWIRVVENPHRKAAAAFNRGMEAARGTYFCLFSAHGIAGRMYIRRSVEVLMETGADGVGGAYFHEGTDSTSSAIGLAMVSPFGMASPHRFADGRREVDTISHPAYVTASARSTGEFDEGLERNSDYEFNYRMRQAGKVLVFDPSVESIYRPRGSLWALARQFWWYGRWKERVARRHPGSLRPRHLVAPAAAVGFAVAPLLSMSPKGRHLVTGAVLCYGVLDVLAVARARPDAHEASLMVLAAAFPVMHLSWGAGFVASAIEDQWKGAQPNRMAMAPDDPASARSGKVA